MTLSDIDVYCYLMNMKITNETYDKIRELGKEAWPLSEADWGSGRQIDAQNAFFIELSKVLTANAWNKLDHYCAKATSEEMIAAGLGYLEMTMRNPDYAGPAAYYIGDFAGNK